MDRGEFSNWQNDSCWDDPADLDQDMGPAPILRQRSAEEWAAIQKRDAELLEELRGNRRAAARYAWALDPYHGPLGIWAHLNFEAKYAI